MSTSGTTLEDSNLEPGEQTESGLGNCSLGRSSDIAKALDTKEWKAPESNKTVAGTEHTSNLPSTISDDCGSPATVTLCTLAARGWALTIALLGVDRG